MTDKPILFSAPMIRALLDGRKTQDRRVLKPQPMAGGYYDGALRMEQVYHPDSQCPDSYVRFSADAVGGGAITEEMIKLPYAPGDRLYVREACRAVEHEDGTDAVEYLADGACTLIANTMQSADQWGALYHYGKKGPDRAHREGQKVPSIHMPRWASRLTLTVTDVRVQRLQEISEADAKAEGVRPDREGAGTFIGRQGPGRWVTPWPTAKEAVADLWNSIHGPDAWDENPWVCAISFDVHRCNIDQMGG